MGSIEKTQLMIDLKETLNAMTEKQLLIFIAVKLTIGQETNLKILQGCLNLAQKIKGMGE